MGNNIENDFTDDEYLIIKIFEKTPYLSGLIYGRVASIGKGYQENYISTEKKNKKWYVYQAHNGEKMNLKKYPNLIEALLSVIDILSLDDSNNLKLEFLKYVCDFEELAPTAKKYINKYDHSKGGFLRIRKK